MPKRIETGTDFGVGIWDKASANKWDSGESDAVTFFSEEASSGRIVPILLEEYENWGGYVDVYVDEPLENVDLSLFLQIPDAYLLKSPTGKLIIEGLEEYGDESTEPPSVHVKQGEYSVHCYVNEQYYDNWMDNDHDLLREAVGQNDYDYWESRSNWGCYTFIITFMSVAIIASSFTVWWLAIVLGILLSIGSLNILEFLLKLDKRYKRIDEAHKRILLDLEKTHPPAFIFNLQKLDESHHIKGGVIELTKSWKVK